MARISRQKARRWSKRHGMVFFGLECRGSSLSDSPWWKSQGTEGGSWTRQSVDIMYGKEGTQLWFPRLPKNKGPPNPTRKDKHPSDDGGERIHLQPSHVTGADHHLPSPLTCTAFRDRSPQANRGFSTSSTISYRGDTARALAAYDYATCKKTPDY